MTGIPTPGDLARVQVARRLAKGMDRVESKNTVGEATVSPQDARKAQRYTLVRPKPRQAAYESVRGLAAPCVRCAESGRQDRQGRTPAALPGSPYCARHAASTGQGVT